MRIEQKLRDAFNKRAGSAGTSNDWPEIQARIAKRDHRNLVLQRVGAAALTLGVVGGGMVLLWLAFTPGTRSTNEASGQPGEVPSFPASEVAVGGSPRDVAAGLGAIWVSEAAGDQVLRLDPTTGQVERSIAVNGAPGSLAAAASGIWVAGVQEDNAGVLWKIDPATDEVVATIPLATDQTRQNAIDVAASDESVWVTARGPSDSSYALLRVDPQAVVTALPFTGYLGDVAVDDSGAVWVLRSDQDISGPADLVRLDPVSNEITVIVPAKANMGSLAISADAVWASSYQWTEGGEPALLRIDIASGSVDRIPVSGGVHTFGMATDGTGVWFITRTAPSEGFVVARWNDTTDEMDAQAELSGDPVSVAFDPVERAVWVAHFRDSLTRTDSAVAPG